MTEEQQHIIEQYLSEKMSPQEKEQFEEQLKVDKDLQDQVRLYMQARAEIQQAGREMIKKKVSEIYETTIPSSSRIIRLRPFIVAAAAVIVLLIAFVLIRQGNQQAVNPEVLFAQYYEPEFPLENRSAEIDSLNYMVEGLTQFRKGQFDLAINYLSIALDSMPDSNKSTIYFFMGQSQLNLTQVEEAIASFDQVQPGHLYEYRAGWNIALAYLKLDELDESKKQLRKIISLSEYQFYHEKANALLEQLES